MRRSQTCWQGTTRASSCRWVECMGVVQQPSAGQHRHVSSAASDFPTSGGVTVTHNSSSVKAQLQQRSFLHCVRVQIAARCVLCHDPPSHVSRCG